MTLEELKGFVESIVDDIVETSDLVRWLNAGQNRMAIDADATFPQLTTDLSSTFVFDEKYHEVPVLYAAARYKEQDSSLQESRNFMVQFEDAKKTFVAKYEVPFRYRDDPNSQQFVAVGGETGFTITKSSYDYDTSDLQVYVNGIRVKDVQINEDASFTLMQVLVADDCVTCMWEEHSDLVDAPYSWWREW